MAFLLFRKGEYGEASNYLQQSLDKALKNSDLNLAARALDSLANLAVEEGNYDKAGR